MFDVTTLMRGHIEDMPAYEPVQAFEQMARQLHCPVEKIIKLDANENPYGAHPAVGRALAALNGAHVYPDSGCTVLREALAAAHGIPVENIIAGAGSDELIDLIMRLLVDPDDVILNCPPTFGMYAFDAGLYRARLVQVARRPDFSLDLEAIENAVAQEKPKILFLASPNNPDGSLIPAAAIERLLKLPVLVVLDEAYIEFAGAGRSFIGRVPEQDNLVVLRTFSKWAGLAGLRVGYGAFPAALAPHLWKVKQPYTVSVAASTAALVSLQHADELNQTGQRLVAERERLLAGLRQISYLSPLPSQANFILCKVEDRAALELKHSLAWMGILVRYFNQAGLKNFIRISVGRPQDTDALLEALRYVA